MPKAKPIFKENRKKGKQKSQSPETADEFLAGRSLAVVPHTIPNGH